VKKRNQKSKER